MPRDGYYNISGVIELVRRRRGGGASGVVDVQVGASLDDGYSDGAPSFNAIDGVLAVGNVSGVVYDSWARIDSIAIPQGAIIDVAYITVVGETAGNDGAGTRTNIYLEDTDNTTTNPTTRAEHEALTRTTNFTAWDDVTIALDEVINSPSIVAVVQELVDRALWANGNNMRVLWDDDGSLGPGNDYYRTYSYDGSTVKAPKLHVEWHT